jgi:hypothetical protein
VRVGSIDTTVTWTLKPKGVGTWLSLEHVGFGPETPFTSAPAPCSAAADNSTGSALDQVLNAVAAEK